MKPLEAFHRWARRDGRQVYCKACRKAYDAECYARTKHRRKPFADRHTARQHSRRKLLAEIEKCELVCANCHALRTVARSQERRAVRAG